MMNNPPPGTITNVGGPDAQQAEQEAFAAERQRRSLQVAEARRQAAAQLQQYGQGLQQQRQQAEQQFEQWASQWQDSLAALEQENQQMAMRIQRPVIANAVPPTMPGQQPGAMPQFATSQPKTGGYGLPSFAEGGQQGAPVRFNHGRQSWEVFFNGTWQPTTYEQASVWSEQGQAYQVPDVNEPVAGAPQAAAPKPVQPALTPPVTNRPAFQPGVDPYPTDRPLTPEESAAIAKQLEESGGFAQAAAQFAQQPPPPLPAAAATMPAGGPESAATAAGPSQEMQDAWKARQAQLDAEEKERKRLEGMGDITREQPQMWRGARGGTVPAQPPPLPAAAGHYPTPFYRPFNRVPLHASPAPPPEMPVAYAPPGATPLMAEGGEMVPPPLPKAASAITGEEKHGPDFRIELLIKPAAIASGEVTYAEGETPSALEPGTIVAPVHETPAANKAIRGNLKKEPKAPMPAAPPPIPMRAAKDMARKKAS